MHTSLSWAAICGNEDMFEWLVIDGGHDDDELSRVSTASAPSDLVWQSFHWACALGREAVRMADSLDSVHLERSRSRALRSRCTPRESSSPPSLSLRPYLCPRVPFDSDRTQRITPSSISSPPSLPNCSLHHIGYRALPPDVRSGWHRCTTTAVSRPRPRHPHSISLS